MKVFTIGYAGIQMPEFIGLLKQKDIYYLIDVRSTPRSQYFSAFNDNSLKKELNKRGIEYLHFKDEFGARQGNDNFYTDGQMDFDKFSTSKQFLQGFERVKKFLASGKNVCLMCAEIDPINCHRAILCAKAFYETGIPIEHIIAKRNGEILFENHNDFEKRLFELHKTNDLPLAYKKQNQKIGYRKNEKKDLYTNKIIKGP